MTRSANSSATVNPPQSIIRQAATAHQQGRLDEAERLYTHILKEQRDHFDALHLLGVLMHQRGRSEEGLGLIARALAINARSADAYANQGRVLAVLQRHQEALASYDLALALKPDHLEALVHRGNALHELKRSAEALTSYDHALALRPNYADALNNRGVVLQGLRRYDEALASFDHVLALLPNNTNLLINRGNALAELKRFEEALASYDRVIALQPDHVDALYNRGKALKELRRYDEALETYDRALAVRPNYPEALNNTGSILWGMKRLDEALARYDHAIALRPDYADALYNRAGVLKEMKRLDEALAGYDLALSAETVHPLAFSGAADCAIKLCDWDKRALFGSDLNEHVRGKKSIVSPFLLLGYRDDPKLQLQCAKNYIDYIVPAPPQPIWNGQTWRNDKLRVAYVSGDFNSHPVAFLAAELFEKHDRSKFEFIGISFGMDDGSEMRRRLVAAFDRFYDVRSISDSTVAKLLGELQADIAIDLTGYTQNERPAIFAHRPAPIQVNYLGYPGTMGAPFIDYVIADKIVAPFELQPHFSEKIVHLPDCYQANDTKRKIAARAPTRQEAGLPDQAFVFCCFNNSWKITPEVFDVWMRLLHQVEDSVLWLLSDKGGAGRNLRAQAQRHGIDPSRIVFASQMPPDEHLARHALADLFLDTLPYNAHTTASDALWTGLPLVTCIGVAVAGRVAASILHAASVPELITANLAEYEGLALKLAKDPARLAAMRAKLVRNRDTCALFNTDRFARHIEAAFVTMWETWQRGEKPKSFSVEPID